MTCRASDRKNPALWWLFALLALCVVCYGSPTLAAAGWTDAGTVGEFNQQPSTTPGSEMLFFTVSVTPASNVSGCSVTTGFYFPITTDLQKRMFTMLLAAKTSGQSVRVYYTGVCHLWGYAEAQGILLP
jgi:hypothetical protein